MAVPVQHFGRPAQLIGAEVGKETLDRGAPLRLAQTSARRNRAIEFNREDVRVLVESRVEPGEALVVYTTA